MSDLLVDAPAGPDRMWSPDLPPSRGQHQAISVLACRLLEVQPPATRLDASILIARLQIAIASDDGPPLNAPDLDGF